MYAVYLRRMAEKDATRNPAAGPISTFLRLYLALTLFYVFPKFLYDLLVRGWIDFDWVVSPWPLILPLGQAIVFWLLSRRWRAAAG